MLRDYRPLVGGLEHLQYVMHWRAIQEENGAIITDVCSNDASLSCPCKVHIDYFFFFADGRESLMWANQYVYL